MNNRDTRDIKKSDILPGGLGSLNVNGISREVTAIENDEVNGSVTLTIGAIKKEKVFTEDADFEVVKNTTKQVTN